MLRRALAILGTVTSIGIITAAPVGATSKRPTTPLSKAAKTCGLDRSHLSDRSTTLEIDTEGDDDFSGDTLDEAACVFRRLKMPSYVRQQVESTRALDGMQRARWGHMRAVWTYHPDDGLSMTIHQS